MTATARTSDPAYYAKHMPSEIANSQSQELGISPQQLYSLYANFGPMGAGNNWSPAQTEVPIPGSSYGMTPQAVRSPVVEQAGQLLGMLRALGINPSSDQSTQVTPGASNPAAAANPSAAVPFGNMWRGQSITPSNPGLPSLPSVGQIATSSALSPGGSTPGVTAPFIPTPGTPAMSTLPVQAASQMFPSTGVIWSGPGG